ncbi:protein FAM216A isoform X2 [Pseudophryne corroboree]|uniref:protein FAM216A isoform X2 n=1 Tax=Pseudophryne corroboree TaxID=495146 RepID=UPI0030821EF4
MNDCTTKHMGKRHGTSQSVPITSQVKTIQIPRSMKNATFLKHPDLTMGQKRYLCSIAKIYSTNDMRALTYSHLHSQIRCGNKKTRFKSPSSGKIKHEIKEHCRRSQLDHLCKSSRKTGHIEKGEGKSSLEDSPSTSSVDATTEGARTIEEAMSEQMKSLTIKDPGTSESTAYTTA